MQGALEKIGLKTKKIVNFGFGFLITNFNKSSVRLDFLILYMVAKFLDNPKSITMLLFKILNFKFFYLKLCIKMCF